MEADVVRFTHILCPTDLSDASSRSLTYAATLARWYKAKLTVLHVVPSFDPMSVRSGDLSAPVRVVYPVSREGVLERLRQIVDGAGAASLGAALSTEAGDPVRTIVDQAVALGADLVVMGTHGRSGFERLFLGSVAEKALRKAPCPVMTVPPHATSLLPAEVRFRHILCPIDFSAPALQALGFALDLARQVEGTVTLLHAIEWLTEDEPPPRTEANISEYRQMMMSDIRERLRALVPQESPTRSTIREVVVLGRAHREILRVAAETSADLIVMGAQGRGAVGLALFGSATQQVVRAAECPVLTVRGVSAQRR
jgi:nucleotide-binding universal stress UspA family protein